MPIFYTGKGDKGVSHVGKKKIQKTNPFVEALGQLDELNSMLGVLKSTKVKKDLAGTLHEVQESLFIIQANLAYLMLKEKRTPPLLEPIKVERIEAIIERIENKLNPAKKFVISGTTHLSAWLDLLRAKSRNVERSVLRSDAAGKLDPGIRVYLNRLSSLFFALARWESRNKKEKYPSYK
ncbi:MAG: cob(I)yrinic acid a,c-diamide adenosyltransferase [Candidatus Yanofskybacteria bacterium]|nr:cob(I)yrinic acid a,c-diamide adenosyltransferase [Candidatus Yanofskybacteria bacterium]